LGLKRKKKREYSKNLKTVKGVFDEKTRLTLYKLLSKNQISSESIIKEGKESVVLSGLTKENKWVAIKIYRTDAFDFKTMNRYLVSDPRFPTIRRNRRSIVNMWCKREFRNLKTAFKAGIECPEPLFFSENILIMDFIGVDGVPAPRLIDIKLENPEKLYKKIIEIMKKSAKNNLIHGDLSAYNILFLEKPILIDFSHGTTTKNRIAQDLLRRDIKNINLFFSRLKVNVIDDEKLYNQIAELF